VCEQISAELFDTIEYIARRVRNWCNDPTKERPFGGLQVICCGDFFQVLALAHTPTLDMMAC
jgi:hypothetical protein